MRHGNPGSLAKPRGAPSSRDATTPPVHGRRRHRMRELASTIAAARLTMPVMSMFRPIPPGTGVADPSYVVWALLLCLLISSTVHAQPVELMLSCGRFEAEVARCRAAAGNWARATGNRVRVLAAPQQVERRLALYQELLGVGTDRLDVLEIDSIWTARLAPDLLDLKPYLAGAEQGFQATLIANDTVDGRLVALPWFVDLGLLYYRTDLLAAAAIRTPETWPQLEDAAMRIQDSRRGAGDDRFWGFLWQGWRGEGLTCNALEWIASWRGGGIVEPGGRVSVDNPRAAYALSRARRWLGLISPESVLADSEAATLERFAAGNAAFMRHWPYAWEALQGPESAVRGNVGVAPLPKGGVGGRHAAALGGWQLAVSRHSRHPDAAVDLVRYLTSTAVQRARAIEHGYLPSRSGLLTDSEVLDAAPYMRFLAADSGLVPTARPSTVTGVWYPDVSRRIQSAVFDVLMARLDADEAVAGLAAGLNRLSQGGTNWSARALAQGPDEVGDEAGGVRDRDGDGETDIRRGRGDVLGRAEQ